MANNNVTALNMNVGNSAAPDDPSPGSDNMADLAAGDADSAAEASAGEWVADFCKDYGEAMLFAGQLFLYVGLALAVAVAAIEIYVAFKSAHAQPEPEEPSTKAVALSLPAVIEALKSLLTALSSARIWLALTILGLLLLWMAATAPRLCMTGDDGVDANGDAPESNSMDGSQNTIANAAGNSIGNATEPASRPGRPRPPSG